MLESRQDRNKLRNVVFNAEDRKVISKEEAGFIVSLVERFRGDVEKKVKQYNVLAGEIAQLKINEQIIIDLVQNMIAAAERDVARQETMRKLKEAREVQEERREELKDDTPEQP
ncbi:MAG: hypothetical protein DRQ47_04190 [Gammaproteobacteria bacterium]|nr:MAG: hypothetical protein DRQ47_04190 [Gammaproteobacteria bacterium]